MIIYLNLNEKGECRKERGKGEIVFQLGSKSIIFENRLTDVTGGGCFLGKKSDLKMRS